MGFDRKLIILKSQAVKRSNFKFFIKVSLPGSNIVSLLLPSSLHVPIFINNCRYSIIILFLRRRWKEERSIDGSDRNFQRFFERPIKRDIKIKYN